MFTPGGAVEKLAHRAVCDPEFMQSLQVNSSAERASGAGENDCSHRRVPAHGLEDGVDLEQHLQCYRVESFRSGQRDRDRVPGPLDRNVFLVSHGVWDRAMVG
jgi:hypothetical protein